MITSRSSAVGSIARSSSRSTTSRPPKVPGRSSTSRSPWPPSAPCATSDGSRSVASWSTSSPAAGSATCTSRRWIPPSLAKFKKELGEFRHKEGLVIDERWNGGGNIEQELLGILVQRPYEIWQPRGVEPTERPFTGYFGPKVVLQNWRSASNAEMFPAGFRALGLGKVVGTPTMGAVIGTGSYSLIDGSTIRTPGVGVFLADSAHTNMENHAVQPDIYVENSPEDNLAGRDRQLEVAVAEVMKDLKPRDAVAKQGRE